MSIDELSIFHQTVVYQWSMSIVNCRLFLNVKFGTDWACLNIDDAKGFTASHFSP